MDVKLSKDKYISLGVDWENCICDKTIKNCA